MKYLTKPWSKEYDGILFFFQRLEEMLFHYSDDIVRVPIHNTHTLLKEYLIACENHRDGTLKQYQCDKILEELCYSIKTDKILLLHFGETFVQDIEQKLRQSKEDIARYLNNKLPDNTYFCWCVQYIGEHAPQHSHKNEIEFGLKAWVVELISQGYSPEYIYNYLHSDGLGNNTVAPNDVLFAFLTHFNLETKTYQVHLGFSYMLAEYKELFQQRLNLVLVEDDRINRIKVNQNDFIGFFDIQALDPYAAVSKAFRKISLFLRFYRVISNRRKELIRKTSIVKIVDEDLLISLPIKPKGYHSIEVKPETDLLPEIDSIIIGCQKKSTTYTQLNKIADLHNVAIAQKDLDNGFLNLWSIMEIVSADMQGESKMSKVVSAVVPILQKDYFQSVFENIHQDLVDNLIPQDYQELMEHLSPLVNKGDEEIAKLICLPQNETLLELYFKKLERYPVIRNKMYQLYVHRDSKNELLRISKKYAQRVEWHLYRLYRTRNAIVHSGKSHSQIQFLGEHLHIYVDHILLELSFKLSSEDTLKTINDVLVDAKFMLSKITRTFEDANPVEDADLELLLENYYYRSLDV